MKISAAICTYNGEKYIKQQLESILSQSRAVEEIIIIDDKSTDKTIKIIDDFKYRYPDKIFFSVNKNNLGVIKNFEIAIKETTGDIIFLSDQDDIWYPDKVEKVINYFSGHKKALLIFSDATLINEQNQLESSTLWGKWNFSKALRKSWKVNRNAFYILLQNGNKITGATIAFRKSLKEHIFPFNLPKDYYHDAWLGLVASGLGGLDFIEEPLIYYRIHSEQQVGIGNGVAKNSSAMDNQLISYDTFSENVFTLFPKLKPGFTKKIFKRIWAAVQKI